MAGELVPKPKGKKSDALLIYEEIVQRTARALVTEIVLPGDWYLVRWGGTRKGSGTFYTRPQLAVPTTARTLAPLAYDSDGTPKKPEEIFALKVCDRAMGSGSFLLASLRYLTGALFESLHHHGRIAEQAAGTASTSFGSSGG